MNTRMTILLVLLTTILGCGSGPANMTVTEKLAHVDKEANDGPFTPSWESLGEYEIPAWYQDAKFGIFIHWGAYSVPGYGNEWYPREMYNANKSRRGIYQHHLKTYGDPSEFGYKDFIPLFKAEKFDATEWAKLFKEAGAKYMPASSMWWKK